MQCNSIFKKDILKLSLPIFSTVGKFHSAFLPSVPLLYATTNHIASIYWAHAPSVPHTATKVIAIANV